MNYISVKNWDKFQHYKDRNPPWIKLHRDLLRDYHFTCLQDASKLHLMLIWLLASQLDNKIPNDPGWIRKQIGIEEQPNLKDLLNNGFIVVDSGVLADCKQGAIVETEAYKEETEVETEKTKSKRFAPPTLQEVKEYCIERNNFVDPEKFIDFYESKGWMIGKNKMKQWQAAVRTWEKDKSQDKKQKMQIDHPIGGYREPDIQ